MPRGKVDARILLTVFSVERQVWVHVIRDVLDNVPEKADLKRSPVESSPEAGSPQIFRRHTKSAPSLSKEF